MVEQRLKILIVEDEIITAKYLQMRFEKAGYNVANPITYGDEAIQFAQKFLPDIVLMDIELNGDTDGISAAQEILKLDGVSLFFITGYENQETRDRADQVPHSGYLVKPLRFSDILEAINSN